MCLACCGGVSDTTKIVADHTYYCNTWCELRSPCCVPSSDKQKRCHASYKTGALAAVVPACLKPLSVRTTGAGCQNKFLMQTWKQLWRCFSGDILKLGQDHQRGAACREGLQMTWQYCETLSEMCGPLNSFCSFSEFYCWPFCLWKVLAYLHAHIQGKTSIAFIPLALTKENWHQKKLCGQMQ